MMSATGFMASLLLVSAEVIPATLEGAVCRPEYKNAPPEVVHTACKPPNHHCKISGSGLPNDKKAEFLKLHNDFRMKVAKGELPRFPKAAAMYKMVWDDEVAEVAQAHADQCTVANRDLRHDDRDGRFTTKFRMVGQNLAWRAFSAEDQDIDVTYQVTSWFNEHLHFNPAGIKAFTPQSGKATGHFTQIIWAETQFLGCGFTQYTLHGDRSATPYQKIYVCNYAPAGNFLSFPIYEVGAPCSKCPKDTTCHPSIGLCELPNSTRPTPRKPTPGRPVSRRTTRRRPISRRPTRTRPISRRPTRRRSSPKNPTPRSSTSTPTDLTTTEWTPNRSACANSFLSCLTPKIVGFVLIVGAIFIFI